MSLFQTGDFILHSGSPSKFKIDCDALADSDIVALAGQLCKLVPPFTKAHGIPSGGLRIAWALQHYASPNAATVLIVDDVLTTGASMEEARLLYPLSGPGRAWGAVIFARGPCSSWIRPLFTMTTGEK